MFGYSDDDSDWYNDDDAYKEPMRPQDWLAMLLGVIVLGLSFVGGHYFGMWFLNKFF